MKDETKLRLSDKMQQKSKLRKALTLRPRAEQMHSNRLKISNINKVNKNNLRLNGVSKKTIQSDLLGTTLASSFISKGKPLIQSKAYETRNASNKKFVKYLSTSMRPIVSERRTRISETDTNIKDSKAKQKYPTSNNNGRSQTNRLPKGTENSAQISDKRISTKKQNPYQISESGNEDKMLRQNNMNSRQPFEAKTFGSIEKVSNKDISFPKRLKTVQQITTQRSHVKRKSSKNKINLAKSAQMEVVNDFQTWSPSTGNYENPKTKSMGGFTQEENVLIEPTEVSKQVLIPTENTSEDYLSSNANSISTEETQIINQLFTEISTEEQNIGTIPPLKSVTTLPTDKQREQMASEETVVQSVVTPTERLEKSSKEMNSSEETTTIEEIISLMSPIVDNSTEKFEENLKTQIPGKDTTYSVDINSLKLNSMKVINSMDNTEDISDNIKPKINTEPFSSVVDTTSQQTNKFQDRTAEDTNPEEMRQMTESMVSTTEVKTFREHITTNRDNTNYEGLTEGMANTAGTMTTLKDITTSEDINSVEFTEMAESMVSTEAVKTTLEDITTTDTFTTAEDIATTDAFTTDEDTNPEKFKGMTETMVSTEAVKTTLEDITTTEDNIDSEMLTEDMITSTKVKTFREDITTTEGTINYEGLTEGMVSTVEVKTTLEDITTSKTFTTAEDTNSEELTETIVSTTRMKTNLEDVPTNKTFTTTEDTNSEELTETIVSTTGMKTTSDDITSIEDNTNYEGLTEGMASTAGVMTILKDITSSEDKNSEEFTEAMVSTAGMKTNLEDVPTNKTFTTTEDTNSEDMTEGMITFTGGKTTLEDIVSTENTSNSGELREGMVSTTEVNTIPEDVTTSKTLTTTKDNTQYKGLTIVMVSTAEMKETLETTTSEDTNSEKLTEVMISTESVKTTSEDITTIDGNIPSGLTEDITSNPKLKTIADDNIPLEDSLTTSPTPLRMYSENVRSQTMSFNGIRHNNSKAFTKLLYTSSSISPIEPLVTEIIDLESNTTDPLLLIDDILDSMVTHNNSDSNEMNSKSIISSESLKSFNNLADVLNITHLSTNSSHQEVSRFVKTLKDVRNDINRHGKGGEKWKIWSKIKGLANKMRQVKFRRTSNKINSVNQIEEKSKSKSMPLDEKKSDKGNSKKLKDYVKSINLSHKKRERNRNDSKFSSITNSSENLNPTEEMTDIITYEDITHESTSSPKNVRNSRKLSGIKKLTNSIRERDRPLLHSTNKTTSMTNKTDSHLINKIFANSKNKNKLKENMEMTSEIDSMSDEWDEKSTSKPGFPKKWKNLVKSVKRPSSVTVNDEQMSTLSPKEISDEITEISTEIMTSKPNTRITKSSIRGLFKVGKDRESKGHSLFADKTDLHSDSDVKANKITQNKRQRMTTEMNTLLEDMESTEKEEKSSLKLRNFMKSKLTKINERVTTKKPLNTKGVTTKSIKRGNTSGLNNARIELYSLLTLLNNTAESVTTQAMGELKKMRTTIKQNKDRDKTVSKLKGLLGKKKG